MGRVAVAKAREQGWSYAVPHFRGCSGELNLAPRAYHSGDYEEVEWILQRMSERRGGPVLAADLRGIWQEAALFNRNFEKFRGVDPKIIAAGPQA